MAGFKDKRDLNRVEITNGSSVYDTKEMSLLIDEIVTQAKELKIEVMSPGEIEQLKEQWGR